MRMLAAQVAEARKKGFTKALCHTIDYHKMRCTDKKHGDELRRSVENNGKNGIFEA